jgi:hypothetical protein
LKFSALFGTKSWRFPAKCPAKKRHKNNPVKAIQYFFAIDDFKSADFAIIVYNLFL